MKINLTPEIAYVIGMWTVKKSKIGVGIYGMPHIRDYFIKGILNAKLMPTNKILNSGKRVYFYHNGYKKFFSDIEKELEYRFRKNNQITSAFYAGMFDAGGKIEKDACLFFNIGQDKFHLIEKMGFRIERAGKFFAPVPQEKFKQLIKEYSQVMEDPYFNSEAMEDWVDEPFEEEEEDEN
jgi:hypothetical protein